MESPELVQVQNEEKKFYDKYPIQVPCPACNGSGHVVLESKITVVYDPYLESHIPGYKLDIRIEHCIVCKGTGILKENKKEII